MLTHALSSFSGKYSDLAMLLCCVLDVKSFDRCLPMDLCRMDLLGEEQVKTVTTVDDAVVVVVVVVVVVGVRFLYHSS